MRTIVITNQKGGCGKTTTAVNLAAALAYKGQRVLVVDLDPQAHATLGLGYEPDNLDKTIYHSLAHQQVALSQVIIRTRIDGLDLVPSNILLAKAEQELTNVARKEFILADQLKKVSNKYDICVIDCPPSLGLLTFNALVASTDVIVPVQVHYYALEGLKQLLETVKIARKRFYPCSVKILGILLTFVEGKSTLSQQVEQQMRQFFGDLVFDTVIHRTISLAEAPSAGESISTYAPESKGAAEYKALAEEVTEPEYKRKRRLPMEVSAIVDEVERESAEEAGVLKPSSIREVPKKARQRVFSLTAIKSMFAFLSISAIVLVIVVVVLMIFLNMTNNPPVARPYSATIQEDVPATIELHASDFNGDRLTYHLITSPSHGTLSGTGPNRSYTPEPNYNGPDSFSFMVNDGTVDSNAVTVSITITAVNDESVANSQSAMTKMDRSMSLTLTGGDIDSDTLKFAVCTQPAHGTLAFGSNFETSGKLIYTPWPNFTGTDSFTFKLNDGKADSAPAKVSIDVTPNHPPLADLQSVTATEDTSAIITLNGSDPDGDTLIYNIVTAPSHGSLRGAAPNLTYVPDANFSGPDSLTFKVNDGTTDSAIASVSITITPVNDIPTAKSDDVTMLEDTPTPVPLVGIDPDGNPLTYSIVKEPSHGSLSGNEPNLTYTPNLNFNGSDSFTFTVSDGTSQSIPATISLKIMSDDDIPTANGDSLTAVEDKTLPIVLTGSDPDGDPLTYHIVKAPIHGSLSGTAPNVIYTPDPNFSWLDSFTFKVNDGKADSVPATVLISVQQVNDPPTANDDNIMAREDTPTNIDVMANDTEVDNELLKITAVTQGRNGSVSINPDGTLTYKPNANFYGKDMFTYVISDREGETDTATVKVTVDMVNDAPVITSAPLTIAMTGVLYSYDVNAKDPDMDDTLTYSLTSQPPGMTIDPVTGLILWAPTEIQGKTCDVVVKVIDSNSIPASDTQPFKIELKPTPPKRATLAIADGYDQKTGRTLLAENKVKTVHASDNNRLEIQNGSYMTYDFSDVSVPPGAKVTSVIVYIEHFEEQQFALGKLQWEIGQGWPDNPKVWLSINAPVRKEEQSESMDSWNITSFVDTTEKINSFQLKIKNSDNLSRKKSFVDYIYAEIEWSWPTPPRKLEKEEEDDDLELIR